MESPEELETLARHHEEQADQLRQELSVAHAENGQLDWLGPAATRFQHESAVWSRDVQRTADELAEVAADLRRAAAALRAEQRELSVLEARVRDVLGPRSTRSLPPTGDPQWRSVAKELGLK